jgi:hypothetical protein
MKVLNAGSSGNADHIRTIRELPGFVQGMCVNGIHSLKNPIFEVLKTDKGEA